MRPNKHFKEDASLAGFAPLKLNICLRPVGSRSRYFRFWLNPALDLPCTIGLLLGARWMSQSGFGGPWSVASPAGRANLLK